MARPKNSAAPRFCAGVNAPWSPPGITIDRRSRVDLRELELGDRAPEVVERDRRAGLHVGEDTSEKLTVVRTGVQAPQNFVADVVVVAGELESRGLGSLRGRRRHEKGIAAGQRVHFFALPSALPHHFSNGGFREQRQTKPAHRVAGELSEQVVEPVIGTDLVVAVGDEQERGKTTNPAADELEQVQRGVVDPMGVFDHDYPRDVRTFELGEERREEALAADAPAQGRSQRAVCLLRHVMHGPEWPRSGERVAHSPEREHAAAASRNEMFDQARFAHSCFAGDRRDPAGASGGVGEEHVQLRKERLALEEVDAA